MPFTLGNGNLNNTNVGSTITIDLTQQLQGQGIPYGKGKQQHTLRIHNESGSGFYMQMLSGGVPTSHSFHLPAGGWIDVFPKPGDTSVLGTVEYTIPNAPVNMLLSTLYMPGEPVPAMPQLGNSPVGGVGAALNINNMVITPQAQQTLSNNSTIMFTGSCIHITSSGDVTGIIMQAGSSDGQMLVLLNDSSHVITFAASGSNVGSGSNNIINPGRNVIMFWNANASPAVWQNHGGT